MQPSDFLLMIGGLAAALSDPELKQLAGAALIFSVGAAPVAFSPDPRAEGRKMDGPAFVDRLPHWLMIGGAILTTMGFLGLAFARNKEVATNPDSRPPAKVHLR
jgi:hypothetical protein